MTTKFLSLPDEKQCILRMELSLLRLKEGRRPLVATAEAERLAVFWSDASGGWQSWQRKHSPLQASAVPPRKTPELNFSRRLGLAGGPDFAALVYKRSLEDEPTGLYMDVLAWDESSQRLAPVQEKPYLLPLPALGYSASGLDLWADWFGDRLAIVAQLVPTQHLGLPSFPPHPRDPQLVYMETDAAGLHELDPENPAAWRVYELGEGGWDFDVRREKATIYAVHRKRAEAILADLSETSAIGYFISDDGMGGERADDVYAPLTLLKFDPQNAEVEIITEQAGIGEHPLLHSVEPFVISVERPGVWTITGSLIDQPKRIRFSASHAHRDLIMPVSGGWDQTRLFDYNGDRLPTNLVRLQEGRFLAELEGETLRFSTLLPLCPTVLVELQDREDKKDLLLVFTHPDRETGGLRADFYSVRENPTGSLSAFHEGSSLWDINHAQIDHPDDFPAENAQFRPQPSFEVKVTSTDVLELAWLGIYTNTLGGLLVANPESPHTFYAYVDMGDGGGRVIYASDVERPRPTAPPQFKTLLPDMLPDPGVEGLKWVRLQAPGWQPSGLPGYQAPYIDLAALGSDAPRAYGSSLVPLLDFLERLDVVAGGWEASETPLANPWDVRPENAAAIQELLLGWVPFSRRFRKNSPFRIQFTYSPGILFAGQDYTFRAQATDPPAAPVAFAWTIESVDEGGPETVELDGAEVSHTFPVQGRFQVTLRATAAGGQVSERQVTLTVAESLWGMLWEFHANINRPPEDEDGPPKNFDIGSLSIQLSKYRLNYTQVGGVRTQVRVEFLSAHDTQWRFLPNGPAQGMVDYRMRIELSSREVRLMGGLEWLAPWVRVERFRVRLHYSRPFTPGVLTSDRRSHDPVMRTEYANLGRADKELVRKPGAEDPMLPAALAAKPLGPTALEVASTDVRMGLTNLARGSLWGLVAVLLVIAGAALLPLLIVLAIGAGVAGWVLVGIGISALISLLVSLGLAFLVIEVAAPALINLYANNQVRESLDERAGDLREDLDDAGLLTYAGEGLAEALAIQILKQGRSEDGLDLPEPDESGLVRSKTGVFETVAVTEGTASVLVRTGTG